MNFRKPILGLLLFCASATPGSAQLFIDFNSTSNDGGPHPQTGYNSYDAAHENASDFFLPATTAPSGPPFPLRSTSRTPATDVCNR